MECEVFKFYAFFQKKKCLSEINLKNTYVCPWKKSEYMKVYWVESIKMRMCYVHDSK